MLILSFLGVGYSVVTTKLQAPIEVTVVVSDPEPTGWWRDYCNEGRLVPHLPEYVQIGGAIQRVKISNIRSALGEPI